MLDGTLLLRLLTCNDPNGGVVKNGVCPYFSRIAATPIPPAVQIEISPRPEPRSASCFASPATMRAPVAPNGWPTATLPPFGFILPRLIEPKGCVRLRRGAGHILPSPPPLAPRPLRADTDPDL